MKALLLTDGKPGHENQSIAFCRHLGLDYEKVTVSYLWKPAKALSYLFDRLGIYTGRIFQMTPEVERQKSKVKSQRSNVASNDRSALPLSTFDLRPSTFDLIVSAGSTCFYPNKVLARKLGIPNVAILNPQGYRPDFTRIFCPAYDHPPKRANITELPLNLCAADESFFDQKAEEFKQKHKPGTPAATGFIIGGPNAISVMDTAVLKAQLEQAFALTESCERWVTTSRRTPAEVEAVIDALPFDYRLINSRDPYNPVPAFIRLCDRLFVTSDSASMISECASFGTASVEILMNRQLKTPNKFQEFIQGLEQRSAVHIFDGTLASACSKIDLRSILTAAMSGILDTRN